MYRILFEFESTEFESWPMNAIIDGLPRETKQEGPSQGRSKALSKTPASTSKGERPAKDIPISNSDVYR